MSTNTECNILADTFDTARSLSKYFISRLDEKNIHDTLIINGVTVNSPYWIVAHLAWAESFLLINALGGEYDKQEWLNEYGFGSKPEEIKTKPPFEEVKKIMDEVHEAAMKHLRSLDDSFLSEKNKMGMNFSGKDDNRIIIHHAIRHEPMHIGQLGWFLKATGVETF